MANIRAVYTGKVLFDSVKVGTLESLPNIAVATFRLLVDKQGYPFFVKGVPAIALRRYIQVINELGNYQELTVTVEVDLLATGYLMMAFAMKVHWHVFGELRDESEARIKLDKNHLFDGVGLPPDWPRAELTISEQGE